MSGKVEMLMQRLDVTRKGAKRIADIMEAGKEILQHEGFTALTKRRIAKRLGISYGNVGYYFPTRESLWRGVIEYELKSYYEKDYANFRAPVDDPNARLEEFVRLWFREYEDRELRIFFSQLIAFSEVSEFVAGQRDEIYRRFFDETLNRIRAIDPGVSESELNTRASLIVALLEGLHAVTAFKPELLKRGARFSQRLVEQVRAIACGGV
ncbi:MAG: TetR/AcrR family transcriptional regulator [Woeseiaceae bacterium]